MTELQQIATAAREHATNVANDINKTSTRVEYIRLTQLAIEADRIAKALEDLAHNR